MTGDRWGDLSRAIVACVLERPERLAEVPRDLIAHGPTRDLFDLLSSRSRQGLAFDWAAIKALPAAQDVGGPGFLSTLMLEPIAQTSFGAYLAEARDVGLSRTLELAIKDGARADELVGVGARFRLDDRAGGADDFRRLDIAGFLSEPPPEPDWLLDGFIEHGELVWLAGLGKAGKSMTALFMVCAALSGADRFLGAGLDALDWCLYIDGENRERTVRRRVHLAGIPIEIADRIDYRAVRGVDLGSEAGLDRLRALVDREGRGMVVFDSLIALHRADEDSAGEVRRFVTGLRAVLEGRETTGLGIAHENRGGNLRGSLDWRNAADTVLELKKDEAGWRTLKIGDRRDGPEGVTPRLFRFVEQAGRLLMETTDDSTRRTGGRPPTRRQIMADQIEDLRIAEPDISKAEASRRLAIDSHHGTFREAWKEVDSRLAPGGAETAPQVAVGLRGGQGSPPIGAAPTAPTAPEVVAPPAPPDLEGESNTPADDPDGSPIRGAS